MKVKCERCETISEIEASVHEKVECPACGKKGMVFLIESNGKETNISLQYDTILMV